MIRFGVRTAGVGITQVITVPDRCTAIVSFSAVGRLLDPVTGSSLNRVGGIISADLSSNFANAIAGQDSLLLCSAEHQFPKIPVTAGERLLVAFEYDCSAVIFFSTVDDE